MRRDRRDARITACGDQALVGDRRCVVAVDEVVRDARVIGILLELGFQHRGRLQVGRVGLVGLGLRAGGVERGEDLRFVVVGVTLRQRLVGLGPCRLTLLLGTRGEVLVVSGDGVDVGALTLGLGADAPALVDRGLRLLSALGRSALSGERIGHQQ